MVVSGARATMEVKPGVLREGSVEIYGSFMYYLIMHTVEQVGSSVF